MSLLLTRSNAQLTAEEESKAKTALPKEEESMSDQLAVYIRKCWERAKKAKTDIADQMIDNIRQRNGEYSPEKQKSIKSIGVGAEVFMMITNSKCRSGEAWVRDILFQPGAKPWNIEPTPIPELPQETKARLMQTFIQETIQQMVMRLAAQGVVPDPNTIALFIMQNKSRIEENINKIFNDEAKRKCELMKTRIEDQLVEGGWYDALDEIIYDVITLKACIMKGPVKRLETLRVVRNENGALKPKTEDRIIPEYDRVSPFDIFPAPDSTGPNDGYLIERIALRRDQIAALLKMPEESGFVESEIRAVLQKFKDKGHKEQVDIDSEKEVAENRDTDIYDTTKIDALQFWGPIPGSTLKQWGGSIAKNIKDLDIDYNVIVTIIDSHTIQAIMNDDPVGGKPYSVTSYEKIPGAFWGNGVPELIADCQQVCNAAARGILNNIGIASGPQVERNIDRIPEGENKQIFPWKVWDVTNEMISAAPALTFYQPPMVVEKLMAVYQHFSKIADEHSGIPAYAHGDPQVGGAGNTASGLSMLMTSAARGIKSVIKNIDKDIIASTVRKQYMDNLEEKEMRGFIGDMKIVASGSSALLAKEQQAIRINEFARTTANPIDFQIMGPEGRKYILQTSAKALDLDVGKAVPENLGPMNPMSPSLPGQAIGGAAPMPGQQTLDAAGNPAQGTDFKLFEGGPTNA